MNPFSSIATAFILTLLCAVPVSAESTDAATPEPKQNLETLRQQGMEPNADRYGLAHGERPAALKKPDTRKPTLAEKLVVQTIQGAAKEQERKNPDRDTRPKPEPVRPIGE